MSLEETIGDDLRRLFNGTLESPTEFLARSLDGAVVNDHVIVAAASVVPLGFDLDAKLPSVPVFPDVRFLFVRVLESEC